MEVGGYPDSKTHHTEDVVYPECKLDVMIDRCQYFYFILSACRQATPFLVSLHKPSHVHPAAATSQSTQITTPAQESGLHLVCSSHTPNANRRLACTLPWKGSYTTAMNRSCWPQEQAGGCLGKHTRARLWPCIKCSSHRLGVHGAIKYQASYIIPTDGHCRGVDSA